ncbi:MAG: AmmeMemoRadiSam system protein B [Armatimonadetes bacterium]|nr:AmmeMemoRadiSam system protein B [Armatimonadota bacterium]
MPQTGSPGTWRQCRTVPGGCVGSNYTRVLLACSMSLLSESESPLSAAPLLRPVEAVTQTSDFRWVLRDPSGIARGVLVVTDTQLFLLSQLDGSQTRGEIQTQFARRYGAVLPEAQLESFLGQLDRAGYLAGPGFEEFRLRHLEEYRAAPFRPLRNPDGFGAAAAHLPQYLDRLLETAPEAGALPERSGRLVGLIAPHLDFARGAPCYAAAYRALLASWGAERPARVVVLGTNHFGLSRSVTATWQDFQTPWGVLATDREFLERLEARSGGSLRPSEADHLQEHSIELHAVWIHHLLGPAVRLVPVLCPDPNGPLGTQPGDPAGVDLLRFA